MGAKCIYMFPSIKKRPDPLVFPKLWNFYILGLKVKFTQSCPTLWDPIDCSLPGSSVHGIHTGVGSHSLLQGIFPTQGLNPGLPHCGQILYHLSHQGSPSIVE